MTTTTEVIESVQCQIAAYQPFAAQLDELKAQNASLVFDYADEIGAKAARSHIYKLRRTRSAVDAVRKTEKDESLQRGRLIDGEARDIMSQIEEMIAVHQKPLDEIDTREVRRIGGLQAVIDSLIDVATFDHSGRAAEAIAARLDDINSIDIDARYAEFMAPATQHKQRAIAVLEAALDAARKREADAVELDRLRAEAAARERKDREDLIARNAAENAIKEAEIRGLEMQDAASRREQELTQQAEKSKAEATAAQERADISIKATEERIKREAEGKVKAEAAAQAKREADKEHMARVNSEAKAALIAGGLDDATAVAVITLVVRGKIPHVTIRY